MPPFPLGRLPRRAGAAAVAVAAAALALPRAARGQAQATTGVIRGVVTDSAGRPLEGVTVALRNLETNAARGVTTNARGAFVAPLLRVGTYDVVARRTRGGPAGAAGAGRRHGAAELLHGQGPVTIAPPFGWG